MCIYLVCSQWLDQLNKATAITESDLYTLFSHSCSFFSTLMKKKKTAIEDNNVSAKNTIALLNKTIV